MLGVMLQTGSSQLAIEHGRVKGVKIGLWHYWNVKCELKFILLGILGIFLLI
jgi:hypothetical protein